MKFRLAAFLLGAMLAAIPLILHFLYRRRGPRVYFPTLRFLSLSVRKTARRKRVENLLLLLFRMALFGLLAMALAEPLIPSRLASTGPRDIVVILDNSYSMGTRELGAERFRLAKETTAELLRQSTRVALIVTSGPESQRPPVLVAVDNDLRSLLANCRIFAGKADVTAALVKAYGVLADAGSTSGQIFVISDLQANSFPTAQDHLPTDRAPDVPVIVYDCGRGAVRNVALVGLEARGGLTAVGSSVELIAEVLNVSDAPMKDLPVTVYLAGRAVGEKRVTLDARSRAKVSFTVPLGAGSVQTGWVQLPPDSLEMDNRLNFRIGLRDRINVLLVRDEAGSMPALDESFFLARALDPRPQGGSSDSPLKPNVILTGALNRDALAGVSVVYLLNVRSLDDSAQSALARYVRAGGNLFILPGDRVAPEAYVSLVSLDRPDALLRARLLGVLPTGRDHLATASWKVVPVDFDHPFLAKFKSLGPAIFERISVTRFHAFSVPEGSNVQVLANLVPGEDASGQYPFLAVGPAGEGKVILAACPANTAWGDFPAARVFVPLMHEIAYSLAGGVGRLESHLAGQPVRLDFPSVGKSVSVTVTLDGGVVKNFTSHPDAGANFVVVNDPLSPGIYPYGLAGGKTGADAFVVNPDPAEADIVRVAPDTLAQRFGPNRLYVVASPIELADALERIEGGVSLTSTLFLLVIAIAVAELFVANRTRPVAQADDAGIRPFGSSPSQESAS